MLLDDDVDGNARYQYNRMLLASIARAEKRIRHTVTDGVATNKLPTNRYEGDLKSLSKPRTYLCTHTDINITVLEEEETDSFCCCKYHCYRSRTTRLIAK